MVNKYYRGGTSMDDYPTTPKKRNLDPEKLAARIKAGRKKNPTRDAKSDITPEQVIQEQKKIPTTASEAIARGWKPTGTMKMSNPPSIGYEKDGKVIFIRQQKSIKNFDKRPKDKFMKKGGSVSKYSKGGGVRAAKYKI